MLDVNLGYVALGHIPSVSQVGIPTQQAPSRHEQLLLGAGGVKGNSATYKVLYLDMLL